MKVCNWGLPRFPAHFRLCGVLSVALLSIAGAAGTAGAQSILRDDFVELATLSFRASRSFAVAYHLRMPAATGSICGNLVVYKEGARTQLVPAVSDFACPGSVSPLVPAEVNTAAARWVFLSSIVDGLTYDARVTETERRTIAGLEARCFVIAEGPIESVVCVESESSVVLMVDVQRGGLGLTLNATRMTGRALPAAHPTSDLLAYRTLLLHGMETSYTMEMAVFDGRTSIVARSGGVRDYVFAAWPEIPGMKAGSSVEIHDGADHFSCRKIEGSDPTCSRIPTRRIQAIGSTLIWKLLGDPEAEAKELEPRTLVGRAARCFEVTNYVSDDNLGTWTRASRETATVCLDRELGAVLLREIPASNIIPLAATRLIPSADPNLFKPPYPVATKP